MKLIMNDGQQVPVQTVTETGGTLKIRLLNQTSAGLKAIFQDALAVQKMTAKETGQADRVYEGYTELVCISEYTGAIWEVEMRKTEADPDTRLAQVEAAVEKLTESGGKIPDSAMLALQYATRVVGIRAGEIVFDGPADQVDQAVLDAIYQGKQEETA